MYVQKKQSVFDIIINIILSIIVIYVLFYLFECRNPLHNPITMKEKVLHFFQHVGFLIYNIMKASLIAYVFSILLIFYSVILVSIWIVLIKFGNAIHIIKK